jgi:two-component system CheB/CheR fusion protein
VARNAEVSDLYNVLENLINSANLPIIMVDSNLNIKRVTPMARKIFNIIPGDVGRPITDLKLNLKATNLVDLINNVLSTLTPRTLEVQDNDGRWYSMSIQLYRTTDNRIEGVVLTFTDIDKLKKAEASLQQLALSLGQYCDAVVTLDLEGKVTAWNKGAEAMYGYTSAEALGMGINTMVPPQELPQTMEALDLVKKGEYVPTFKSRRFTKSGKTMDVILTLKELLDASGNVNAIASLECTMPTERTPVKAGKSD